MKKMKALQIIAAAMAVTVAATSAPVNVFAYGETSIQSLLHVRNFISGEKIYCISLLA